ncbi:MAG: phosphotransferase [Pseudomonadota bacterium]
MNEHITRLILSATGAQDMVELSTLQSLWSGYGSIVRYGLTGADRSSVVVKHVRPPLGDSHPRGWNTSLSHTRKLRSYAVEAAWYQHWRSRCDWNCYAPQCLAVATHGKEVYIVLEDLTAAGYDTIKRSVSGAEMDVCLTWLAHFHATFLGEVPKRLWPTGTYWHLATRPDELDALDDRRLREAAVEIDRRLTESPFQTFVHGDAKLANFCFTRDGTQVAAVDFQYVGGGCGMKDLAYFVGSCLDEADCERLESRLLDTYFERLASALDAQRTNIDLSALEKDWRALYPVAWTDFHRFIKGWSPGHWKINGYSERIARDVVDSL